MRYKGTIAAVLSAALFCTVTGSAMAADNTTGEQGGAAAVQQTIAMVQQQKMQVTEIHRTDGAYDYIIAAPIDAEGKIASTQSVQLNLNEDTVYMDTQTGIAADPAKIRTGDVIYAYYSAAMTRSIPPQAACYAVVVNLEDNAAPAHYLTAESVTANADGSVTVMAENGSILVMVGKDAPISPYLTKNIVTSADIKVGSRFFAWYDVILTSYPGRTGASRVVLLPSATDGAEKLQYGESHPYRFAAEATVTEMRTSIFEGDIVLVPSVTVKTADGKTVALNLGENTWFVDNATGKVARWADVNQQSKVLQKGTEVLAFYGAAITAGEPSQVAAEAIVVNRAKGSMPHLLTAENVTMNPDNSVTLLGNSGGSLVTVSAEAPISSVDTEEKVRNTDIRMGTELLAWYDTELESYPTQAGAEKVVLLPNKDRELSMIAYGDTAIGTAKVENGVVMIPLRLAAETLGFTVTWNGEARSVHLTDGAVQTTVTLGEDGYYKATAIPGAVGLTASFSLGAPSYEVDGRTWAPAELMNLLLGERVLRLHDSVLYI